MAISRLRFKSWNILLAAAGALFCASVCVLVHDSMALSTTASQSDLSEIVSSSRPVLFDILGHPMRLMTDHDYERALLNGGFRARPRATVAMVSQRNVIALVDVRQAPMALMRGWALEPLDQELARVIRTRQSNQMWLGYNPDLWFQSALFWISAIFLCGAILIARDSASKIQES